MVVHFHPRFVDPRDLAALSNLWHLSRTAIKDNDRHKRLLWTAKFFVIENRPDLSETAVYKDLTAMLDHSRC